MLLKYAVAVAAVVVAVECVAVAVVIVIVVVVAAAAAAAAAGALVSFGLAAASAFFFFCVLMSVFCLLELEWRIFLRDVFLVSTVLAMRPALHAGNATSNATAIFAATNCRSGTSASARDLGACKKI